MAIINILQILLLILLGLSTLYIFVFAVAGLFYTDSPLPETNRFRKIALLIPGYKEDAVITDVTRAALAQDYPRDMYDVVVIADSFHPETINKLRELPVVLIEVSFEKSTKSKALNKAMEQLNNDYDIAVILDADNLMEPGFLQKMNEAFELNFLAVQGHRMAKNMNTSLAILDAVSEEINNHIFRRGHRVLGFSSAIIGSGMGFRYTFFRDLMKTVNAVGGFDKEIELKMLKARNTIAYLDNARIYDEKVQSAEVFSNQRRRWLSAQVHYFRKYFADSLKELLVRGNMDYFDKTLQMIQLPRILLLGTVIITGLLFTIYNIVIHSFSWFLISWIILMGLCIFSLLISVPGSFYRISTLKAMTSLPKGMLLMLMSLLRIKGANKQFIHTKHTSSETKN
jgi:cellulose synthase/poly-beta-1,6-N-acetylglucosamine synthase-like glycosyltransferase